MCVLEKVVLKQLQEHLTENSMIESHQSAYRKDHSTETVLLSVTDSLLSNMDKKFASVTAFLDLSAAFDTIDREILLQRLQAMYGIQSTAFKWFSSYLSNRTQSVSVKEHASQLTQLPFGVPQGSVLGPVLFILYTQPFSVIIQNHSFTFEKFADDTEIQKAGPPPEFPVVCKGVKSCVSDIKDWMNRNRLKLNEDKTELLATADRSRLNEVKKEPLVLGSNPVTFKSSVKYLGVVLDETLSMDAQISSLCRNCHFHLRKIAAIRPYLSQASTAQLVSSMVLSRLDYCNSILAGLPSSSLSRLQKVQNCAARLVLRKKKHDHATPLLRQLHWLPINARIEYKLATLAFKFFDETLPPYLSDQLISYVPSRALRSSSEKLLKIPNYNLKSAGQRSFHFQCTKAWNSLPSSLRDCRSLPTFKKNLKTYLFKKSFDTLPA